MAHRVAEVEQAGEGPARRDRDGEDFRADEHHHAEDGDEVARVHS